MDAKWMQTMLCPRIMHFLHESTTGCDANNHLAVKLGIRNKFMGVCQGDGCDTECHRIVHLLHGSMTGCPVGSHTSMQTH
eukprot:1161922-Pelagomonas_calceolata.AAC.4